jgi:hypothetical protein
MMETERPSPRYSTIELWRPGDILDAMLEGQFAAVAAVHAARPALERAALAVEERLRGGGRLVYAGAGTSGRLAVQDGAELTPTFGWPPERLRMSFQSRFGKAEWLQPYTDKTVQALAESGVRRMAIVAPGFSADCLETLEELDGENREIFMHHGGEQFAYLPCLNDSQDGMRVIRHVVERELKGWL